MSSVRGLAELSEFPQEVDDVGMMVLVEGSLRRGWREEGAFACG